VQVPVQVVRQVEVVKEIPIEVVKEVERIKEVYRDVPVEVVREQVPRRRLPSLRHSAAADNGWCVVGALGGGGQIIEKEIPVHMPVDRVVEIPVETTVYKVATPNLLSLWLLLPCTLFVAAASSLGAYRAKGLTY
jgi:hypothetical protein